MVGIRDVAVLLCGRHPEVLAAPRRMATGVLAAVLRDARKSAAP
jgi:hypothetical protein